MVKPKYIFESEIVSQQFQQKISSTKDVGHRVAFLENLDELVDCEALSEGDLHFVASIGGNIVEDITSDKENKSKLTVQQNQVITKVTADWILNNLKLRQDFQKDDDSTAPYNTETQENIVNGLIDFWQEKQAIKDGLTALYKGSHPATPHRRHLATLMIENKLPNHESHAADLINAFHQIGLKGDEEVVHGVAITLKDEWGRARFLKQDQVLKA